MRPPTEAALIPDQVRFAGLRFYLIGQAEKKQRQLGIRRLGCRASALDDLLLNFCQKLKVVCHPYMTDERPYGSVPEEPCSTSITAESKRVALARPLAG
jgi:hypothetical protein